MASTKEINDYLVEVLTEWVQEYYWTSIESYSDMPGFSIGAYVKVQGYTVGIFHDGVFKLEFTDVNGDNYIQTLEDDEFDDDIKYITDYDVITFETVDRAVVEIQDVNDTLYICIEEDDED